jgi:YARHG domain/WG containing repeat
MKTKPILIIAAIVIVAIATFFLLHKKKSPPNSVELTQFLYKFNNAVNEGNADTVNACFQFSRKNKTLKNLANLLIGKKKKDGSLPLATVILDIDKAETKNIGAGLVSVKIPVSFSHQSLEDNHSVLILKIYKTAHYKLKIIQADTRKFFDDYVNYETYVKNSIHIDDVVYSDLTLASFKTADQLKTRYDSILWFEHVDDKTFYYVIKGKLNDDFYLQSGQTKNYSPTYKMGLVNADLKEIIPPEYDLIHNVGGTINGFVEVEMNGKKGLYNLDGKNVVVVIYDQIIPLTDDNNLALLRKDDNYFYLKKDTTVTDKIDGFKIADVFSKFKTYGDSYSLSESSSKNIMEYNEHGNVMSIIVPPSYLVDLQIFPKFINFNNPLRKEGSNEAEHGSQRMDIKYNGLQKDDTNWFISAFYSITDHFWDGRSGLYAKNETKPVIIIDKKQNKILSFTSDYTGSSGDEEGESFSNEALFCKENAVRAINDTLFEYKSTSALGWSLINEKKIAEAPYYYYLHIVNGRLAALPNQRLFGCTQYVKMDDSYLNACYVIGDKKIDHVTTELLEYMKNEIYASYGYKFKSDKWTTVFQYSFGRLTEAKNITVDDSLTAIEKYNINWINSKLNSLKQNTLAAE